MKLLQRIFGTVLLAWAFASAAVGQSNELLEAFSGNWYSFEPTHRIGEVCSVTLLTEPAQGGGLKAQSSGCIGPLDQTQFWGILEGQIKLVGAGGEIASLGGHQIRMTGIVQSRQPVPIILERAEGGAETERLRRAIAVYRCFFEGYANTCAQPEDLTYPPRRDAQGALRTLVDLNFRAEPRRDAALQGTIPRGTKVSTDICLVASDGPWCRVQFEARRAWVARNTLRQDTWPIITFLFE